MNKSFTQQLKDLYGSHKVVDFYDEILSLIELEDKNKLYWLDSCSIGHYLDIVFKLSNISSNNVDIGNLAWMNTGLKFKNKAEEVCFKLSVKTNVIEKKGDKANNEGSTNDGYKEVVNFDFKLCSSSSVENITSPREIVNKDDSNPPSYNDIDITNSEELKKWDEKAMQEGIEIRREFLRKNNINFSAKVVKDIETNDISGDIYRWFHILIDGCDNLPLPILQGVAGGYPVYFKNESKLLRQYALLEYNSHDKNAVPYDRVHSLKNIISRQIKYSEQLLKDNKIDLLPFYYITGKGPQYMLPLYVLHRPKPDAVLVIDYDKNPYTLLNMKEARMNYGFFRYLYCDKEGKIPVKYKDDWIYPDNCEK